MTDDPDIALALRFYAQMADERDAKVREAKEAADRALVVDIRAMLDGWFPLDLPPEVTPVTPAQAAAWAEYADGLRLKVVSAMRSSDVKVTKALLAEATGYEDTKALAEACAVEIMLDCGHPKTVQVHELPLPDDWRTTCDHYDHHRERDARWREEEAAREAERVEAERVAQEVAERGRMMVGNPDGIAGILRGKTRWRTAQVRLTMGDGRVVYVFGKLTERPWEDLVGTTMPLDTETVTPDSGGVYLKVANDPWVLMEPPA